MRHVQVADPPDDKAVIGPPAKLKVRYITSLQPEAAALKTTAEVSPKPMLATLGQAVLTSAADGER